MYRHSLVLLSVAAAAAAVQTGTSYLVYPQPGDEVPEHQILWAVHFEVTQTNDGTVDAKLQTSWDGTTWHDVVGGAMTQRTAAGLTSETKQIANPLGPYNRVVGTPAGGASISGSARLAANGGFRSTAQA